MKFWNREGSVVKTLKPSEAESRPLQFLGFLPKYGDFPGYTGPIWHLGDRPFWITGDPSKLYFEGIATPIDLGVRVVHAEVIIRAGCLAIATSDPNRPELPSCRLVFRELPDDPSQEAPVPNRRQMYETLQDIEQTFDSNITQILCYRISSEASQWFYVGIKLAVALENGTIQEFFFGYLQGGTFSFNSQETLTAHNTAIKSITFDGIGGGNFLLASASEDGEIKAFVGSTTEWQDAPGLVGRHDTVSRVQILGTAVNERSFNGRAAILVSTGSDGTILLWQIDFTNKRWSPSSPMALTGHPTGVNHMAFNPYRKNAQSLVTASTDGLIKLWRWHSPTTTVTPVNSFFNYTEEKS